MAFPHMGRVARPGAVLAPVLVAVAAAAGCAGTPTRLAHTPESFVIAARAQAPEISAADLVVPFQVTPEMVERARAYTADAQTDYETAERLMMSLTDPEGFGLVYDTVATSPPAVTMARGHGNCLALTSIFIGLAREIGLMAYYVDASDRISDLRREEEIIIDSGHIAGGVRTERGYTLVDYDGHVSRYRTFQIIDDITALAHYYNNLGFEMIVGAQEAKTEVAWEDVLHTFRLATLARPDFTRAHNNLGVAHLRLGNHEEAAAAYRTAIATDPKSDAAYHNLGNLEMRAGNPAGALVAYDRAVELRARNPYLHYHRGLAQYRLGDLTAAEGSFKRAIGLETTYIEPRNLLAQVYYQQGRVAEAEEMTAAVQRILAGGG